MRKVNELYIEYRAGFTDLSDHGRQFYGIQKIEYQDVEISRGPVGLEIKIGDRITFYPWLSIIRCSWVDDDN